jgi:parallel beta-helix repeat protein
MNNNLSTQPVSSPRAVRGLALAALLAFAVMPPSFAASAPKPEGGGSSTPAESRIPIGPETTPGDADATPSLFKITQPGSYFLTGNIAGVAGKSGIELAADGITIDLNGFTLQGAAGSLNGIHSSASSRQLTVLNGTVRGWGIGIVNLFEGGRFVGVKLIGNATLGLSGGPAAIITDCLASGSGSTGFQVSAGSILTRVIARTNGSGIVGTGDGIQAIDCVVADNGNMGMVLDGDASTVVGCSAVNNGSTGLGVGSNSAVDRCVAKNNGGHGLYVGIYSTVTRCVAGLNQISGVFASNGCLVSECTLTGNTLDGLTGSGNLRAENCSAVGNGQHGFYFLAGTQIRGCIARGNGTHGIFAYGPYCRIEANHATGNGAHVNTGAGIHVTSSSNHIEGNTCNQNPFGITVTAGDNLVLRNTARGNTASSFNFAAGVEYGQVITNPGAGFSNSNPWANFAY